MADYEVRITAIEDMNAVQDRIARWNRETEMEEYESIVMRADVSPRAHEIILEVWRGFDDTSCPSCHTFIGWGIGGDDPDTGRPQGAFAPFYVIEQGEHTWPVCEDCIVPVIEAPPSVKKEGKVAMPALHTGEGPTHQHGPAEHAHACEVGDAHYHFTPGFPIENAIYPEEPEDG